MSRSGFLKRFWQRCWKSWVTMAALVALVVLVFVTLLGPVIAPYDPLKPDYRNTLSPPSTEHLFGTDQLGRDILSRVLYGARVSVSIGVFAVLLGLLAGTSIGLVAGYSGGRIDAFLMRSIDVMLAFPDILLAIMIISIFGSSVTNIILALAVFSVPTFARVSRSSALSIKNLEYVQAAVSTGGTAFRILAVHILPNSLAPVVVYGTLRTATAILGGAALSFLGLGIAPPTAEWGLMVSQGRDVLRSAPFVMMFPGLAIFVTVLAVNLLGDALRDVMDPKGQY